MIEPSGPVDALRRPLTLPCGVRLKNRLAKSAMSDSLGNGRGDPTPAQIRLYERWAEGGVAVSFIGEVQGDPRFAERPGNLVLGAHSDLDLFRALARRGSKDGAQLWVQLGHAGALSHGPIGVPKGPSALDLEGLRCDEMSAAEITALPGQYARTAALAKKAGFGGVHLHAGHGFLLSQFLSPLFNHRSDEYGGDIEGRCRIVLEVLAAVRHAVGPSCPVGIRVNSSDQLDGGLSEKEALRVVRLLDGSSVDLIDISGGTYFPGAVPTPDVAGGGAWFLDFARRARNETSIPLMLTGGFKRRAQAVAALSAGHVDVVGLARSMIIDPGLAAHWLTDAGRDPIFPHFEAPPPGGVTAWYTMRLTDLGEDRDDATDLDVAAATRRYEERDAMRCARWLDRFADVYASR